MSRHGRRWVCGGAVFAVLAALAGCAGGDKDATATPAGWIAFSSRAAGDSYEIQVVRADGSGRAALTHHPPSGTLSGYTGNGRSLVFRSDDATWLMSADGSRPRRIPSDGVSPDGRTVVDFDRRGGIVLRTLGGRIVRAVPGYHSRTSQAFIQWSPTGKQLLLWVWNVSRLEVVNVDGSGGRTLVRTAVGPGRWSSDGRRVVFASFGKYLHDLHVINADGTGRRLLAHGVASDGAWSPEGGRIAYTTGKGLYVVAADGGRARKLLRTPSQTTPAWSPGGALVVADATGVHQVDGDGRRSTLLGRGGASSLAWWPGKRLAFNIGEDIVALGRGGAIERLVGQAADQTPVWSPDGRRIAFTRADGLLDDGGTRPQVWVMNADGSRARTLGPGFAPQWSPDGRRLVFGNWRDADTTRDTLSPLPVGRQVWLANAAGTGRRLVDDQLSCCATWSPDGKWIALIHIFPIEFTYDVDVSGLAYVSELELIASDGTGRRVLADGRKEPFGMAGDLGFGELLGSPKWSPDGQSIAVTVSNWGGPDDDSMTSSAIGTVDMDGNAGTIVEGDASGAAGLPAGEVWWSPTGREIASVPLEFGQTSTVRIVPLKGAPGRTILPPSDRGHAGLAWSPDGTRLVLARQHGGADHSDALPNLALVRSDGTGRTPLTKGVEREPSWQPRLTRRKP
jgi:Tol biopolymer transport system component